MNFVSVAPGESIGASNRKYLYDGWVFTRKAFSVRAFFETEVRALSAEWRSGFPGAVDFARAYSARTFCSPYGL